MNKCLVHRNRISRLKEYVDKANRINDKLKVHIFFLVMYFMKSFK